MTDQDLSKLRAMLSEHFKSFVLTGFDLDDNEYVRIYFAESVDQGYALEGAMRRTLNECQMAPEVWVRNYEESDG